MKLTTLTSFLLPSRLGIPILMYHDIHPVNKDMLTVKTSDFLKQLEWLLSQGFEAISLSKFLRFQEGEETKDTLPRRPILITFDDGYRGLVHEALPLLLEKKMKACLFVTTSFIQDRGANENSPYLSLEELQTWGKSGMEIALHSHAHPNYRDISTEAVIKDITEEEQLLRNWRLPFEKALAYPFGARPKNSIKLHRALSDSGIRAAFRIGNRVSPLAPEVNRLEIKRIDIQGTDSFFEFQVKVKKGRTKLF